MSDISPGSLLPGIVMPDPDPFDHYDADEADTFAALCPGGATVVAPGDGRCPDCGYRYDAPGHASQCGDTQ